MFRVLELQSIASKLNPALAASWICSRALKLVMFIFKVWFLSLFVGHNKAYWVTSNLKSIYLCYLSACMLFFCWADEGCVDFFVVVVTYYFLLHVKTNTGELEGSDQCVCLL